MKYKDLLDKIEGAGQTWSQWDLDMAKKHPEFGAGMFTYKQDYAGAKDQAGKTAANQGAEALRRKYGSYLGGSDGSKYYGMGPAPGGYKSPYQDRIDGLLDKMEGYGDFDFGPAPSYTNRYQEELDALLDQVQGYGPFEWSKEKDPAYSAYAKQYRREGERATADALAKASAMSGGQLSSAAMTAASQAGDYYAGQLADKIPELYAAAYDRYLGDYNLLADKLGQTQRAEQMEYGKYVDALGQYNQDRNQAYNEYLAGFDRLQGTLGAFQGQDGVEYDRLLDQIQYNQQQEALAQAQVDAMLQAGVMPGEGLVGQSGYDREYIQAMDNFYKQQAAQKAQAGRPGNPGRPVEEDAPYSSVYQQMWDMGIRSEGDAYAWLVASGYKNTEAAKLAGYFAGGWEPPAGPEAEPPVAGDTVKVPRYGEITWEEAERLVEAGVLRIVGVDAQGNPKFGTNDPVRNPVQGLELRR